MIRRIHAVPAVTLLAAFAFPACSGNNPATSGGSGGASSSSSASTGSSSTESASSTGSSSGAGGCGAMCDTVTGTAIDDWIGEATAKVPVDLSAATLEALVPMGSGQWKTIAGKGQKDGTFSISGVPSGPYVLHVVLGGAASYLYTSARDIDLGSERAGRKDAVAPKVKPTNLGLNLQNLAAWQDGDDIEWFVGNNNAWIAMSFLGAPANPPAVGDMALKGLTLDWNETFPAALIDKGKGDVLTVFQLSTQAGPGNVTYTTVSRFASFNDITQTDGVDVIMNGGFTDVPQDKSASLDLRPTKFASYLSAVNPKATDVDFSAYIITLPGAGKYGGFGSSADLLAVDLGKGAADVNLGAVKYGNPYPAAWGTAAVVSETVRVAYTAPGASTSKGRSGLLLTSGDVASVTAGPIQPLVSPVQDLKVNGMSAFTDLTGVTKTPTVTFTAPAVGAPTFYVVHIEKLANNNGATQATVIADLYTKDTKVDVPPGLLADGSTYFISVRAKMAAIDVAAHPFRNTLTLARADVFSGMISP